jgi:hypothetical protein
MPPSENSIAVNNNNNNNKNNNNNNNNLIYRTYHFKKWKNVNEKLALSLILISV